MKPAELLSGLSNLMEESKAARATIDFSYDLDRIKRRMTELEEENEKMKLLIKMIYEKL